jgi:hypothetical protein
MEVGTDPRPVVARRDSSGGGVRVRQAKRRSAVIKSFGFLIVSVVREG